MVNVFSYCVYGDSPKYCLGMIKNIEQIKLFFPEFEVWVYCGNDVPSIYIDQYKSYSFVKVIEFPFTGGRMMAYRLFCIDDHEVDVMIVRDADSRFEKRDIWCIRDFLTNDHKIFTIRDHPWHGRTIMAGLCGFKKLSDITMEKWYNEFKVCGIDLDAYQTDQTFLERYVYFRYKNQPGIFVAYTIRRFYDEVVRTIEQPRETPHDFCGNVVLFRDDKSEYYEFSL